MMKRLQRERHKSRDRKKRNRKKGGAYEKRGRKERREKGKAWRWGGVHSLQEGAGTHHTSPLGSPPICTTQMAQG